MNSLPKLVIEEWWSCVSDDIEPGTGMRRVLPGHELHSRCSYPRAGGWISREEWRKAIKKTARFVGFTDDGKAKISAGNAWGINSYYLVYLDDAA